jgi:hypothetical protein
MVARSKNPLISALLALFMVFVIPVCWYGALARADATQNSNNNNEEREEHEERDESSARPTVSRPVPPKPAIVEVAQKAPPFVAPRIIASQAHAPIPSRFSERRLI